MSNLLTLKIIENSKALLFEERFNWALNGLNIVEFRKVPHYKTSQQKEIRNPIGNFARKIFCKTCWPSTRWRWSPMAIVKRSMMMMRWSPRKLKKRSNLSQPDLPQGGGRGVFGPPVTYLHAKQAHCKKLAVLSDEQKVSIVKHFLGEFWASKLHQPFWYIEGANRVELSRIYFVRVESILKSMPWAKGPSIYCVIQL